MFRECNYPKVITGLLGTQALFFLALFGNFYRNTYVVRAAKKDKTINHTSEINANHIEKQLNENLIFENGHYVNGITNGNGHIIKLNRNEITCNENNIDLSDNRKDK